MDFSLIDLVTAQQSLNTLTRVCVYTPNTSTSAGREADTHTVPLQTLVLLPVMREDTRTVALQTPVLLPAVRADIPTVTLQASIPVPTVGADTRVVALQAPHYSTFLLPCVQEISPHFFAAGRRMWS